MGKGKNKAHNGVLIVTDRRLCFVSKTFLSEVLETIPLKSISSIERKSVMAHRSVKFHTSNGSLEFKTFQKDALPALIDAIEAGRLPSPTAAVAGGGAGNILDSISRLGELKQLDC